MTPRYIGLSLAVLLAACGGSGAQLETFDDSASYALGMAMADNLQRQQIEVSVPTMVEGFEAAMAGDASLPPAEAMAITQRFIAQTNQARHTRMQEEGAANEAAGQVFLEENGARPEVTTTESGLQYEVLTQGTGPRPGPTDRVRVHYRGTLIDGTEFDGTDPNGEGVTFALNRVIPGWSEGLQLMPVGSKYKLYIPGNLAYGIQGNPPEIGPNTTLIFEVELLAIE